MDQKSIIQYVKEHPDGKVKIAFSDIDGILRGKYISTEKFLVSPVTIMFQFRLYICEADVLSHI